jgi:hypothetical protein
LSRQLENGKYLLDQTEREAYIGAARAVAKIDRREIDLEQPLSGFDYLVVMCAHLIVTCGAAASEELSEIFDDCVDKKRGQMPLQ